MQRKAVLVTGAARRLGREIALGLARRGWDVAVHYHHSQTEAQNLKREVEALGVRAEIFSHDMADGAGIPAFFAALHRAMPNLAALVNNASVFERAPFLEAEEASFDSNMDINLKAPVLLTQAFARVVQTGSVVNMLDNKIKQDTHGYFYYLLSKKALAEFTRMAAATLPNIRVNAVCPGRILPSPGSDSREPEATPQDVVNAVLFLLEDEAQNGQFAFVDGKAA